MFQMVNMFYQQSVFLDPCTHEEAHTRLLVWRSAMVETVDTYIVVLPVVMLRDCGIDQLWFKFGSGKTLRYIPIHVCKTW